MRIPKLRFLQRIPDTLPFTPGWRLFPADEPLQEMRRLLPIRYFRRLPGLLRLPLLAVLLLYCPLRVLYLSAAFARKFGKQATAKCGKRTSVQFKEQFLLALGCGVHPREYYAFEFFRDENRKNAHRYYYLSDMRRVPMLNIGTEINAEAIVNNKHAFEHFCIVKNLAHITSRATLRKEESGRLDEIFSSLPDGEYVLKPFIGWRGEGMVFFAKEQSCYHINGGGELSHDEIINHFASLVGNADFLLQPRLYNHDGLSKIGNGSLLSFRIVTVLNQDRQAELLSAIAQIPFRQQRVSNKGLIAPVDANGKLGEGQLLRPLSPTFTAPPEGGETFTGLVIPCWREAVALALQAHTALGAYISLGWDVAITADGPVLLEANCGWDPTMMQKTHHLPLGKTRLPEMMLHYRFGK